MRGEDGENHSNHKIEVIVPACGDLSYRLPFLRSRSRSPALIPVHTRPLVSYVMDFYQGHPGVLLTLLVEDTQYESVRKELGEDTLRWRLVGLPPTRGVVETVAHGLRLAAHDDTIVNVVTTIPTMMLPPDSIGTADASTGSGPWSSVSCDHRGGLLFAGKGIEGGAPGRAFTGVIRAPRTQLLKACDRSTQQNDLIEVARLAHEHRPLEARESTWIDCGHEINYFDARARLLNSRSFNTIHLDTLTGVITKTSQHREKLLQEERFFEMLPDDLRPHFPRLFRTGRGQEARASYSLEYYGYPNLAEYALYWDLSDAHWERIFLRLAEVLERFATHQHSLGRQAYEDFYMGKCSQRLQQLREQWRTSGHDQAPDINRPLAVNGRICAPYQELEGRLQERISQMYRENDFCVMHGDLCFGNILYDLQSGILRLIDPRGSFGERCTGIYGDQKYDLAKLAHSAIWGYDLFVNGLFHIRHAADAVEYHVRSRENAGHVAEHSQKLVARLGHQLEDIRLIAALLFLSMPPLHHDSLPRQIALYSHGLLLLNQELAGIQA